MIKNLLNAYAFTNSTVNTSNLTTLHLLHIVQVHLMYMTIPNIAYLVRDYILFVTLSLHRFRLRFSLFMCSNKA
jgi:hypothetical protein